MTVFRPKPNAIVVSFELDLLTVRLFNFHPSNTNVTDVAAKVFSFFYFCALSSGRRILISLIYFPLYEDAK